ncbi:AI-2E family transporter [Bacillus sp. H-16]|uniref:AI-2E family transporter n=1 Tax=Alteribacter salitolerans TaxID=2912333 RepID=UPI001962E13F|nr:AI-2E family transporter [Alteribacter salitolerans]MBM7097192.1 AI-2E family transporter [Alteribacter salitolerans]
MHERYVRRLVKLGAVVLFLVIIAVLYMMVVELKELWIKVGRIFLPFLLAVFIAYLLHPAVVWLDQRNVRRPYSILLIFGLFLAVFVTAIVKATPYFIQEGRDFLDQLPGLANTYRGFMSDFHEQTEWLPDSFQVKAEAWLQKGEAFTADALLGLVDFLRTALDFLFLFIVIPFIVFYLLKDIKLIHKVVWYFTPRRFRSEGKQLLADVDESLGNYIRGQLLVCFGVGLVAFIGFWIIGLPYASLIALFIAVTNIIPYFGPVIGAVPVLLIALTESINLVVFALAIIIIVQIVEGNILAPLIVGKSLHMHPVLIIFALVVGGELAGIIGLIVAVPLLAVLKVFIIHIRKLLREKKEVIERQEY